MLNNYENEIKILSDKTININEKNRIAEIIKNKLPSSENIRKEILKTAVTSLCKKLNENNYENSLGISRFIFLSDFSNPMSEIRKQGAFRVSKVNFDNQVILEITRDIYESENISLVDENYLRNVNTLLILAPEVRKVKDEILKSATSSKFFLKTILAIAEEKYCELLWDDKKFLDNNYLDRIFYNNKESILSSVSYMVQLFRESVGELAIRDSNGIDEGMREHYISLIESSFAVTNYLKSEIDVDVYDYDVITDPNQTAVFLNNEDFETAKNYGYVKTDLRMQSQVRRHLDSLNSQESFLDVLEEIWERNSQEEESILYAVKTSPVERIVVAAALPEYGHGANLFGSNVLFKEEMMQLIILMDENYNDDAPLVKICGSFTSLDIFKIQRFFIYIGFIYHRAIEKLKISGRSDFEKLRMNSVLPVMEEAQILQLLKNCTGKPLDECKVLLEELTNAEISLNETIDLQYKPVLKVGAKYLVMPTVLGHSNIIRSLAKSEGVHFSVVGKTDHMVKTVSDALITQGFKVKHDFKFGVDEVDIIAAKDEYLFLFECKNPYHPVNDFELRNTYAHLVKGFSQLENFKERFRDEQIFKQFLRNLSISPSSIKHVNYGVINANRALTGLSKNGIKAFHAGELMNFVRTGKIILGSEEFETWQNENFEVKDLLSYMAGKIVSNDLILHKIPIKYSIKLGNLSLQLQSFEFDLEGANQHAKQKYRHAGPAYQGD